MISVKQFFINFKFASIVFLTLCIKMISVNDLSYANVDMKNKYYFFGHVKFN